MAKEDGTTQQQQKSKKNKQTKRKWTKDKNGSRNKTFKSSGQAHCLDRRGLNWPLSWWSAMTSNGQHERPADRKKKPKVF